MKQLDQKRFETAKGHLAHVITVNAPAVIVAGAAITLIEVYFGGRARAVLAIAGRYLEDRAIDARLWWWVSVRRLSDEEIGRRLYKDRGPAARN